MCASAKAMWASSMPIEFIPGAGCHWRSAGVSPRVSSISVRRCSSICHRNVDAVSKRKPGGVSSSVAMTVVVSVM